MTYSAALERLSQARRFGMKLGLGPMQALAARMGNPQSALRFIHIAGSNGKGSTAAFCESCLRAGGARVGLYTSPHLISIRERIQMDRVPISEEDFAEGLNAVLAASEGDPTFFELLTALALWYFVREKVDWVVWETGLGGRLDATNIVQPVVCIITSISLEHTQYLGNDLRSIAVEKAGIIKHGVPVVHGVEDATVSRVVEETCLERGAIFVPVRSTEIENLGLREGRQAARIFGREYELGLAGGYQVRNAGNAVASLLRLPEPPSLESIARGLRTTSWPGRFQIVSESPLLVLDGAHNPSAMAELLKSWRAAVAARGLVELPAQLVFAASADKDIAEMVAALDVANQFQSVALPPLVSERAAHPADLLRYFRACGEVSFPASVAAWQPSAAPTLVTGSIFLVGEMLAHRGGGGHEIRLNERLESPPWRP